jgi:hypothetical protein
MATLNRFVEMFTMLNAQIKKEENIETYEDTVILTIIL